jgi:EmrB/QacA subfamily drug resistance transporter
MNDSQRQAACLEPPMPASLFPTERNPRLRLIIPAITAVAFLMEQLDATALMTAIPEMARSLGTTPLLLNLAVTAYVITLAVFIPISGWCADRFGARRVFAAALLILTVGSCLCGLATDLATLVVMRAVQGLGGALMTPVGRLILLRSFPRHEFFTAMTYMSLPILIGPVIGPLIGGFLTTYASWRWIFYVNIPFGCAGIVLALRYFNETERREKLRFDLPGFVLVGLGLALLQFGMEMIGRSAVSLRSVGIALVAAPVLLAAFAFYARGRKFVLIDLALFRVRTFAIGTLIGGLCRVPINGVPYLLPLMLQIGFGFSPLVSGSLTFISSMGALFIRPFSAPLLRLLGFGRLLFWTAAANALLIALFAWVTPATPLWAIVLLIALYGITRATLFMTANTLAYADLQAERLSGASGVAGVLQQLSLSFGVSAAAMLLTLVSRPDGALTPARFHEVFLWLSVIPLIALPGFLRLRTEDGAEISGYRARRRG